MNRKAKFHSTVDGMLLVGTTLGAKTDEQGYEIIEDGELPDSVETSEHPEKEEGEITSDEEETDSTTTMLDQKPHPKPKLTPPPRYENGKFMFDK